MILDCIIHNIKYGEHNVLNNVKIQLNRGECLVITGDSGSGKTTVLLYIAGLLNKKLAWIDGTRNITNKSKLVYIAQNPDSNIISNDVKSELILYGEGDISKINSVISKFKIPTSFLDKNTSDLSGGQKQFLSVLCGIIQDVDLYILDEPTAMLDNENSSIVVQIINELIDSKKTIIISTHNKSQFEFRSKELSLDSTKKNYNPSLFSIQEKQYEKISFMMRNIHFSYKRNELIFNEFNLTLNSGDVLLVSGNNGTGKTTLAKLIAGLKKPQKGTIELNGKKISKIPKYVPMKFSYSLQNPSWQLLFESVEKELNHSVNKFLIGNKKKSIGKLDELISNVNINKKNEPRGLSFGQSKFVTNFSYFHNPLIHFFDEPDLGGDKVFFNYFIDFLEFRKIKGLISIVVTHSPTKYNRIANKHITL